MARRITTLLNDISFEGEPFEPSPMEKKAEREKERQKFVSEKPFNNHGGKREVFSRAPAQPADGHDPTLRRRQTLSRIQEHHKLESKISPKSFVRFSSRTSGEFSKPIYLSEPVDKTPQRRQADKEGRKPFGSISNPRREFSRPAYTPDEYDSSRRSRQEEMAKWRAKLISPKAFNSTTPNARASYYRARPTSAHPSSRTQYRPVAATAGPKARPSTAR